MTVESPTYLRYSTTPPPPPLLFFHRPLYPVDWFVILSCYVLYIVCVTTSIHVRWMSGIYPYHIGSLRTIVAGLIYTLYVMSICDTP